MPTKILYGSTYLYVGTDCPAIKYLYRHVKTDIANDWYDIGVELFDVGDEAVLNTIKKSYPGDPNRCAAEMLQLWLARKSEASWNQLLETLREPHIKLNALATKIEGMLSKGTYMYVVIYLNQNTLGVKKGAAKN